MLLVFFATLHPHPEIAETACMCSRCCSRGLWLSLAPHSSFPRSSSMATSTPMVGHASRSKTRPESAQNERESRSNSCLGLVPLQDVDPPPHVRRQHRWAEEEQPAPAHSEKRHPSTAYRAFALVCARGTGKNTSVKREKGGPFEGPTAEAAIAQRDKWIDDYLHAPMKRW